MAEKTPRDLLKTATGESWAQMGSLYITRCDAPGKPHDIAQALREFGIPAEVTGLKSVQVNVRDAQVLDAELASTIKDYLTDGVQEARQQQPRAGWAR